MLSRVILLSAAAALLAPVAPAFAVSGGIPNEYHAELPWTDSKTYRPCGVGCLYEKANENISLEALYILRKIEFLRTASDTEVQNNLAGFCFSGESGRDC